MAKITNKQMYGDLIKAIVAIVVGIAVAAGMVACDNDTKTPTPNPENPTC